MLPCWLSSWADLRKRCCLIVDLQEIKSHLRRRVSNVDEKETRLDSTPSLLFAKSQESCDHNHNNNNNHNNDTRLSKGKGLRRQSTRTENSRPSTQSTEHCPTRALVHRERSPWQNVAWFSWRVSIAKLSTAAREPQGNKVHQKETGEWEREREKI